MLFQMTEYHETIDYDPLICLKIYTVLQITQKIQVLKLQCIYWSRWQVRNIENYAYG